MLCLPRTMIQHAVVPGAQSMQSRPPVRSVVPDTNTSLPPDTRVMGNEGLLQGDNYLPGGMRDNPHLVRAALARPPEPEAMVN